MVGPHEHQVLPKNKGGSGGAMERALDLEPKDLSINTWELGDEHGHFSPWAQSARHVTED